MVEQSDTENFDDYLAGVQEAFDAVGGGAQDVSPDLYQPPVTTRSWFHTGAWLDADRIAHQLRQEYHPQTAAEPHLPEPVLPAGMDSDETRQCLRALKGVALRQETYSFDGSPTAAIPYAVSESAYQVRRLQPRSGAAPAVFHVVGAQTLTRTYERNPTDPRVQHTVLLEVGPFGNSVASATVTYGRQIADPALPAEVTRDQRRDLGRLRAAYLEQNRRDYELTKHISLSQLDPVALLRLRQNGECFVDLPETEFDLDYPGHYFRRIKSVSLSIPAVTGPYTSVACTLTLTGNSVRKDATLLAGKYGRDTAAEDPRFRDQVAAVQSIATSGGQNDDGIFVLDFRDERYLPFEGAGAISSWHLKLNKNVAQFDLATIPDVVLHLHYTAREGGGILAAAASDEFNTKLTEMTLAEGRRGLFRVFDIAREMPDLWYRFLHPAAPTDDQTLVLDVADRLPFVVHKFAKKVRAVEIVAKLKDPGASYKAQFSPLGLTPVDLLTLAPDPTYEGLHRAFKDLTGSEIDLGAWTLKVRTDAATDFHSLPADAIEEMFFILNYTVS